jgi:hypothetical protein
MILALMVSASTGEISPCITSPSFRWLSRTVGTDDDDDDGSASNCCNASRERPCCASGGIVCADAAVGSGSCKKEALEVLLPPPPQRSANLSMAPSVFANQKTDKEERSGDEIKSRLKKP